MNVVTYKTLCKIPVSGNVYTVAICFSKDVCQEFKINS